MRDANIETWVPDEDWKTIDQTIVGLAQKKSELEVEIGRWLLAAKRERVDQKCGFGSFAEYIERRLGYDARVTREKLRVAGALENLEGTRELLRTGERTWSVVREIVRVATPETEAAWLKKTERLTTRQVEALVKGHKLGDHPEDVRDPLLHPRRLVFELLPEDYALVAEAFEKMREQIGPAASHVDALRALAESALGSAPESKATYQVNLTVCASCSETWQKAGGDFIAVSASNAECARCDGEVIGFTEIEDATMTHGSPGNVETSPERDGKSTIEALPRSSARGLIRFASRVFGVPVKTMTPKLRAAVRSRDKGRCVVPGCTHFRFLHIHHHRPRKDGGPNVLENTYSLCTQHHRAVHDGVLAIEGSPTEGLIVRHAGGVLYGASPSGDPRGSPSRAA